MDIDIFTDGSSLGNPGPGGYAAILRYGQKEKIVKGGEAHTTNNRMEIRAVIEALQNIKNKATPIRISSDSTLLVSTMTKGWKKKENLDLWKELEKLVKGRMIEWIWVKGHAGHKENNRVDMLAVSEAKKMQKKANVKNVLSKLLSFYCGKCEKPVSGILKKIASGAIRVDCEHCNKFIKFAKQTKEIIKRVKNT